MSFIAILAFNYMDLILPFALKPSKQSINIKDEIILVGSCFAEEVGLKMKERRFNALLNPHGILFNPLSISRAIDDYLGKSIYTEKDVFHANELWHSFNHHGAFSHTDAKHCLKHINTMIEAGNSHLKKAQWLIVTFGSAFVYKHKASGQTVGNCHKVPQTEFEKILVKASDIISLWQNQLGELKKFNPQIKVIFTVSPVRYVRDGLVENNRSKANLLESVHALVEQNSNCFYFPAYELVTDVLRDHRFYKQDLVHPNEQAIDYVWQRFTEVFCDVQTRQFLSEYEPLLKSMHHRTLHEGTETERKFREQVKEKVIKLEKKYLT